MAKLNTGEQEDVAAKVLLLERYGPELRRPHEIFVPKADALYDAHLADLAREGLIDG